MFGMGMPEIMLILAVALVVIGPKKLPGLAKSIGRAMGEFKSATRDFKRSIDLEDDLQDVKNSLSDLKDIPSYDPDLTAPRRPDAASSSEETTGDDKADAPRTESAAPNKPTKEPETDPPKSPGAESHG